MKNMFKKVLSVALAIGLLGVMVVPAQAMAAVNINIIDLTKPSEDFIVSEPMTLEEMAKVFAEDMGISLEEAIKVLSDDGDVSEKNGIQQISPQATVNRTISYTLNVNAVYKPQLRFYCQTSESGSQWGIVQIKTVTMNKFSTVAGYTNMAKYWDGNIYSELNNAYTIFFIIDGYFHNFGDTSVSGTLNINIGQWGSVDFGFTHTYDIYEYHYEEKTWVLQS